MCKNQHRIPAQIRLSNAIDRDLEDTKNNLQILSELMKSKKEKSRNESSASKKELDLLDTRIRNCISSITTSICKIIEDPVENKREETFSFYTLIEKCDETDKEALKKRHKKIKGDHIYGKLEEHRNSIIVHRNIKYQNYQTNESRLTEYAEYLINNRERIEKLIDNINSLLMDISTSVKQAMGIKPNVAIFSLQVKPRHE